MADFLDLTLSKQLQNQQVGKTNGVNESQKNNQAQKDNKADALKKTDVFTAAKNGMQAKNATNTLLAGGDSGFGGVNAFGDSGFGDTVSFSAKKTGLNDTSVSAHSAGAVKAGGTMANFANNDSELKEIAEGLGVKADESTVKNKLKSMNPEELVKLDGDLLDKAKDLGLISMADVEKKINKNDKADNNKSDEDPSKKIKFGTFTSGSEV